MTSPPPPNPGRLARSLTLERGLRVLRVLSEHPEGLTVSELAEALGTHRAGIYRLLGPHLDERLVWRRGDRYHLGAGLIELASRVQPRLQEVAGPRLQQLADALNATTALTVREGDDAAVVADVRSPRHADLHITYRPGLRHPVSIAASGIAILAGAAPRRTERPEVTEARRRGWAQSTGELLPGATGVAAPVRGEGGEAESAISAVWIGRRRNADMAAPVVAAAREIAAAL
jgi:DNA-binding IclR family transcriptional regulator